MSSAEKVEMQIEDVFGVILFLILTIICIYLTYSTIKQLFAASSKAKRAEKCSIFTLISAALTCATFAIAFIKVCVTGFNDADGIASYCSFVAYLWYFCVEFGVLWILISRIENIFASNTFLSYAKRTLSVLKACAFAAMLLPVIIVVAIIIDVEVLLFIVVPIWAVLYFGLFISLFVMFLNRINKVTNMAQKHLVDDGSTVTVNDQKAMFLELSIRCTLLAGVAVFSSFLTILIGIVLAAVIEIENAISVWPLMFISVDVVVNSICVYFFFYFNETKYYKMCKCGHECIRKWKVKKEEVELQSIESIESIEN